MKRHYLALAFTAATSAIGLVKAFSGETLPMHWNANGEVDRYGSSWELLIIVGLAIFIYALLRLLEKHPEWGNTAVRDEVKAQGYAMVSNYLGNLNVILAVVMIYVMLTVTTIVPFSSVVPILIVAVILGYTAKFSADIRRLNRHAVRGESRDETTLNIVESESRMLTRPVSTANAWTTFGAIALSGVLLMALITFNSADLLPLLSKDIYASAVANGKSLMGIAETVGYGVLVVAVVVGAFVVAQVFNSTGKNRVFSVSNVRKMNCLRYGFIALGAVLFIAALMFNVASFFIIALMTLIINFIIQLFLHIYVKGYRINEEQELTI